MGSSQRRLVAAVIVVLGAWAASATATPPDRRASALADAPLQGYSVAVSAREEWRGSAVILTGDSPAFIAAAGGCWTFWVNVRPYTRGEGDLRDICARVMDPTVCSEPMPGEPKGSLIGRVGGQAFGVGRGAVRFDPAAGELQLRINDTDGAQGDNDGTLFVRAGAWPAVEARRGWQPAGIAVAAGATLAFEPTGGLWTHAEGEAAYNPGAGTVPPCAQRQPRATCTEPLPEAPTGALIGRVGGAIFAIGAGAAVPAPAAGEVWLRINEPDAALTNNRGHLELLAWPRVADGFTEAPECAQADAPPRTSSVPPVTPPPPRKPPMTATPAPSPVFLPHGRA